MWFLTSQCNDTINITIKDFPRIKNNIEGHWDQVYSKIFGPLSESFLIVPKFAQEF